MAGPGPPPRPPGGRPRSPTVEPPPLPPAPEGKRSASASRQPRAPSHDSAHVDIHRERSAAAPLGSDVSEARERVGSNLRGRRRTGLRRTRDAGPPQRQRPRPRGPEARGPPPARRGTGPGRAGGGEQKLRFSERLLRAAPRPAGGVRARRARGGPWDHPPGRPVVPFAQRRQRGFGEARPAGSSPAPERVTNVNPGPDSVSAGSPVPPAASTAPCRTSSPSRGTQARIAHRAEWVPRVCDKENNHP
uniref:proline-rich protein 2-like n=1 Tax=Nyctereutes procyonoides TaxID=34880 RepID=UPI002443DAAA|nr:proline-rich protein 2-like [Nyctereutes procyonoides]